MSTGIIVSSKVRNVNSTSIELLLGYIISAERVFMDQDKVTTISEGPTPNTKIYKDSQAKPTSTEGSSETLAPMQAV